MNKTELIAITAEQTGLTKKDAERILNTALEAITDAMAGHEKVQLSGFGTFEIKHREARVGRNPRTLEPCDIAPSWVPVFKPSQALKDRMAE